MKIEIITLGNNSTHIVNKDFQFAFTIADTVVKDEFKGKYRNFGGIQSNFNTELNSKLDILLIELSEKALEINKLINENRS